MLDFAKDCKIYKRSSFSVVDEISPEEIEESKQLAKT